jgi:hypothetical protein
MWVFMSCVRKGLPVQVSIIGSSTRVLKLVMKSVIESWCNWYKGCWCNPLHSYIHTKPSVSNFQSKPLHSAVQAQNHLGLPLAVCLCLSLSLFLLRRWLENSPTLHQRQRQREQPEDGSERVHRTGGWESRQRPPTRSYQKTTRK